MKILIINYHFPPSNTAHSYRWALLREYFIRQGNDVEVVCGGISLESDKSAGIYRVNFPNTVRNQNSRVESYSNRFGTKSSVKYAIKKIYRKLFWPDGLWHWLPYSLFKLFKLRNKKYDLVVAYTPTFSAVITALFYKWYNENCRLVVDFGDPFSVSKEMPVNNYKLYGWLNKFIETKAFRKASLVSFTNSKTFDIYKEKYSGFSNFCVIPHLVNVRDFYVENPKCTSKLVRIGYVGAFHKKIREPYLALQKLGLIFESNFSFEFYGPLNGVPFSESNHVKHYGVVNRDIAIELTKEFDILMNIENEDCPMTPSKIFECMATGKPIINFLSATKTSSFENYPLVINVDLETKVGDIVNFAMKNKYSRLSLDKVYEILKDKTLESVGNKYLGI